MILFCDTSALLNLFIDEQGSEGMIKARSSSQGIAVCRIAWAESMAAFARRTRFKGASQSGLAQARYLLEQAWLDFVIADVTQPLVQKIRYVSRSIWPARLRQCSAGFPCFDRRLNQAAQLLQLEVLP
ncbi:MAG: type II toxin-antitoxin system VapC family toxin [Synechococcus sp.]